MTKKKSVRLVFEFSDFKKFKTWESTNKNIASPIHHKDKQLDSRIFIILKMNNGKFAIYDYENISSLNMKADQSLKDVIYSGYE